MRDLEWNDCPYPELRRLGTICWSKKKLVNSTQLGKQNNMVQSRHRSYFLAGEDWDKTNPDYDRMTLIYGYAKRDSLPDGYTVQIADLENNQMAARLVKNGQPRKTYIFNPRKIDE